jgi:long-chain acyl-CoA synthetase
MNAPELHTLSDLFVSAVKPRLSQVLMRYKRNKQWHDLTGAQIDERVRNLALGLHSLGVKPGDRVSILAESSPDWSITDYAILSTGAVNVPIYPTQAVDQVEFIIRNSEARILFLSNAKQLKRIQAALKALGKEAPQLFIFDAGSEPIANVTPLAELEAKGAAIRQQQPDLFDALRKIARPDDLATIIYTSGTTGEPKGVMLSHRNLVSNTLAAGSRFALKPDDTALSFLPLSHVFERIVLYVYMHFGVQINYARGVEYVGEDIKEVCPSIVTAVPRLFEKIYATINKRAADATPMQQKIFHRAVALGREAAKLRDQGKRVPLTTSLQLAALDKLVFTKWRAAVGGRLRFFVSGGAAMPPELAYIFLGANILIVQGYGLTETSPVVTLNPPSANRIGTIGPTIPGVKVRLAEDGELLVQGDNVMQGYYKMPEETEKVLQRYDDGVWFHTGDIGTIDPDGYIRITDRKKDLLKTSLGKYIAPQPIENMMRGIPMVEQVIVVGNSRKFPVALIVPNFEALKAYAKTLSLTHTSNAELAQHPRLIEYFKKKTDEVTRELAPHEKIKKIALVDTEFSIESGELTPTLKIRRKFVEDKYQAIIETLYPKTDTE